LSGSGQYQTIIDFNKSIYISSDYSKTFTPLTTPVTSANNSIRTVSMSGSGQYQLVVSQGTAGRCYFSNNYGTSFAQLTSPPINTNYQGCAVSDTGQYQTVVGFGTNIFVSTNGTSVSRTFTSTPPLKNWNYVRMSGDGKYQYAFTHDATNNTYVSSNFGTSWALISPSPGGTNSFYMASLSSNGQYQSVMGGGKTYISSNYGTTWDLSHNVAFSDISMSSTGQVIATVNGAIIYLSTNYGSSFNTVYTGTQTMYSISVSETGEYITAVQATGTALVISTTNFYALGTYLPITVSGTTYYIQLYS
jgi:photosystem II stability/assembly factor-like uncharacterized protein